MLGKKITLLFYWVLLDQSCSYYYMHSTDRHRHISTYDCVSTLNTRRLTMEEEYCRRDDEHDDVNINLGVENLSCFDGTLISFHDLQAQRISELDLLGWYTPIDVIDQYQLFLEKNTTTNDLYFWCNCTSETFGARCEYTFEQYQLTEREINHPVVTSHFYFVTVHQSNNKDKTESSQSIVTNGTCYMGLPDCNRNRIICLHWNQVCDGQVDCPDGEDENNCMTLELNECDRLTEFRCLDGTCIPRSMAFDTYVDCLDASDENHFAKNDGHILETFGLINPEYRCGSARSFPCDDGARVCTTTLWSSPSCESQRDQRFIEILLGPPEGNTNDSCWIYAICQLGFRHFFKKKVEITNTQCQNASIVCSTITNEFVFPFINEHFVAQPSVNFVYHTKRSFDESIVPDFICYNATKCRHLFTPTIKKFNYLCNSWSEIMDNQSYQIGQWDLLIYAVRRIVYTCYLPSKNLTSIVSHLFDCGDGSSYIFKHRLHDAYIDCINGQDEKPELDSCALGLPDRFQCRTTINQCIPRVLLSNGIINCHHDTSDESSYLHCSEQNDYGCRWKRGSLTTVTPFSFLRVCDGSINVMMGNYTDETNCPQDWVYECNSSWTRCDGYWQCRDGHDELNCITKWSTPNYKSCAAQQQFYCVNRTSKEDICYSNELAGNGQEDCVGGVDERIGGYCQTAYPTEKKRRFHCSDSNRCLNVTQLCDGVNDCGEDMEDDEKELCPWLRDFPMSDPLQRPRFTCRNGTRIDIERRCDGENDCAGNQYEDELFCDLEERIATNFRQDPSVFLSDIIVYPPLSLSPMMTTAIANTKIIAHEYRSSEENNIILEPIRVKFDAISTPTRDLIYFSWYCNSGFLVRYFNRSDCCLCSFPFYGDRCQFQRRRVTISFQVDVSDKYSSEVRALKFVFYLKNQISSTIIDYRELIVIPYQRRHYYLSNSIPSRYLIRLLFKEQIEDHYIHIESYLTTNSSLEFQAAWHYKPIFPFLPVEQLSLLLILVDRNEPIGMCGEHGRLMPYVNTKEQSWCLCNHGWFGARCNQSCSSDLCSSNSICRGWPLSCLCPLNYMGPTCRVSTTHVCWKDKCLNNGTCLTLMAHTAFTFGHFYCSCPPQFFGERCESEAGRLTFAFDKILVEQHPHSTITAMILRLSFLRTMSVVMYNLLEQSYRHFYKYVNLNLNQTVYFDRKNNKIDFSFLQLFTNPSRPYGDYYLISANNTSAGSSIIATSQKQPVHTLDTIVRLENHIPYIDQLFNSTILNLTSLERVKFYQRPCRERTSLVGFHDDTFMCICNRHRLPQCYVFIHYIANCSSTNNICLNKALCLQDDELRNPRGYVCICEQCFFGDFCQLTTSQYSISLDALIGQRLAFDNPIYRQPASVQLCLAFVILFFVVGLCLNSLTIALFSLRAKLRDVDSVLYVMASSFFGICSLTMLCTKFISLIVLPQMAASQLGCASIEYLLKLFPTICDWLNACVVLEQLSMTQTGVIVNTLRNKRATNKLFRRFSLVAPLLVLLIAASVVHDPIHRQSIVDHRLSSGRRPWCIVKFDQQSLHIYNIIINIIHYVVPFSINLLASIFILLRTSRIKSNAQKIPFSQALKQQFLAYKHWILSPLLLALLALPRLIFAVTFTCISSTDSWQSQLLLTGYFIGFLPQIGTLVIFVLPSQTYKEELVKLLKRQRS